MFSEGDINILLYEPLSCGMARKETHAKVYCKAHYYYKHITRLKYQHPGFGKYRKFATPMLDISCVTKRI